MSETTQTATQATPQAERRKTKPCVRAINEAFERAARVIRDITPYQRPRPTAMKVSGDFNLAGLRWCRRRWGLGCHHRGTGLHHTYTRCFNRPSLAGTPWGN